MGRPKKKIQKREKVFNFISKVIDIIKYKWKTVIKTAIVLASFSVFIYVVFFWISPMSRREKKYLLAIAISSLIYIMSVTIIFYL